MKLKSDTAVDFFVCEKIELYGVIPASELKVIQPRKLTSIPFIPQSAIVIAVPYYFPSPEKANLSMYARSRDYHLYFTSLFERLTSLLDSEYAGYSFKGFADSSPYDERSAALSAGLGLKGDHGLVICPPYGSYVFLGMLLTDLPSNLLIDKPAISMERECLHCYACKRECPSHDICLSSLTQKKGKLSEEECSLLLRGNMIWGCDLCQSCCPLNINAQITPIDFFKQDRIEFLTRDMLYHMSDDEFSSRAYSWRKKDTILRNIDIFDHKFK